MDKDFIESLAKSLRQLRWQAKEMYREAYALDSKRFYGVLADRAVVSLSGDYVLFSGREPWQYGEHLEDEFPLEWFYTDWQKEVIAFRDARERKELAEATAERKKADELEHKRYLKLKKKWGN